MIKRHSTVKRKDTGGISANLYCYKMTDDSGFAPNPYHGILTLATCKPYMRENTKKGDWIAGFTSKRCGGIPETHERLIYLMKVSEKITYDEYWEQYPQKRNNPNCNESTCCGECCGDNIYHKDAKGNYIQEKNGHHNNIDTKIRDLKSEYVLISSEFFYFGEENALEILSEFDIKPPKFQTPYGKKYPFDEKIIDYIESKYTYQTLPVKHHVLLNKSCCTSKKC